MQQHDIPTLHVTEIGQALFERLRIDSTELGLLVAGLVAN
jgi:hypothetical protein